MPEKASRRKSGPGKPGRPRMSAGELSKWGLWKRAHRDTIGVGKKQRCPSCGRKTYLSAHHTDNNYGKSSSHTVKVCTSCHNKKRKGKSYT